MVQICVWNQKIGVRENYQESASGWWEHDGRRERERGEEWCGGSVGLGREKEMRQLVTQILFSSLSLCLSAPPSPFLPY